MLEHLPPRPAPWTTRALAWARRSFRYSFTPEPVDPSRDLYGDPQD